MTKKEGKDTKGKPKYEKENSRKEEGENARQDCKDGDRRKECVTSCFMSSSQGFCFSWDFLVQRRS